MERVAKQKQKPTNGPSLSRVSETIEILGMLKRSNSSSGSRSTDPVIPDPATNENGNREKTANTVKRVFFVFFISSLPKTT